MNCCTLKWYIKSGTVLDSSQGAIQMIPNFTKSASRFTWVPIKFCYCMYGVTQRIYISDRRDSTPKILYYMYIIYYTITYWHFPPMLLVGFIFPNVKVRFIFLFYFHLSQIPTSEGNPQQLLRQSRKQFKNQGRKHFSL